MPCPKLQQKPTPAIHAEQNAIINAGRDRTQGATLYLFGSENGEKIDGPEPCLMCDRDLYEKSSGRACKTT